MKIELTEQELKDLDSALMLGIGKLNADLKDWLSVPHPDRREPRTYDIFERHIAAMRTLTNLLHKIEDIQEQLRNERNAEDAKSKDA